MDFNFNLKEAAIYQAVEYGRALTFIRIFKKLFLILFVFVFSLFLYGFLGDVFSQKTLSFLLGCSIILLTLFFSFWLKIAFFNSKLKEPRLKITIEQALTEPGKHNLAEFLNFETAQAINKSLKFARLKKLSETNSTILFYFLLRDNQSLNFIFSRALLSIANIKNILKEHFKMYGNDSKIRVDSQNRLGFSEDFQNTILESLKIAGEKKRQRIKVGDMLFALAKHNLIFKEIIITSDIKIDDIENLTEWLESLEEAIEERKKFWEWKNLIKKGSLAKEWTAGFTVTLDRFSIDLSEIAKKRISVETIGHKEEITAIERILSRQEINDVLLIGEPGVGRKSIIQGLAIKSILGQTLPELNYKRIVALDIPAILSRTENREEAQVVLDEIFREVAAAGNVILVINDFHNFVRTEIQPGIIDISGTLSSYLPLSQFQVIAITTYAGLHKYIERKPAVLEFFEKVEVAEISKKETIMFLERLTLFYEKRYKKFVSYPALREIVSLTGRYLPDTPFPKKAIGLLDEIMIYVSTGTKDKIVLPRHVAKIISEKTQIPIGQIETKEREILLNLEKLIHQRIINQKEAVAEISAALRRARAGVTERKGPMGTFLFLGPTGVGKTESSKALAEIYFSSEDKMIRMDMSEFQDVKDIPRLIGSVEEEGLLTVPVRENPFSLILLDEIEKAHPNILNLFLQVLDEGHLTDGLGRKVDFGNTIIIATSNAGYQIILEAIKTEIAWSEVKQKLLDSLFKEAIFRPEFINRFDAVIVFRPLTKENLLDIAELMFQKLKKNLKEKNIKFVINEPLKEKIVELGYDPLFGARELKRVMQNKVENILASALLSGELKKGDEVEIIPEQDKFQMKIN